MRIKYRLKLLGLVFKNKFQNTPGLQG